MYETTQETRPLKIVQVYKGIALLLLNTILLFFLVNLILYGLLLVKQHLSSPNQTENLSNVLQEKKLSLAMNNPISLKYGIDTVRKAYPSFDDQILASLLEETWSRPYMYEPFTQFKERPYQGQYIHVTEEGYRYVKNQAEWPPQPDAYNIFIFGGSTMFGYGVRDEETVASYLQEYLAMQIEHPVAIYNFGRGNYYSTQELILFLKLLSNSYTPHMAIFVDGLNDFFHNNGEPMFTQHLQNYIESTTSNYQDSQEQKPTKSVSKSPFRHLWKFLKELPIYRAAQSLNVRLQKLTSKKTQGAEIEHNNSDSSQEQKQITVPNYKDQQVITTVIRRYLTNKLFIESIAQANHVIPVFVWQPVPTYHYDLQHHLFATQGFEKHTYSQYGYPYFKEYIEKHPLEGNFLWCAEIQKNLHEPLYVDQVHYNPRMSKLLAQTIAQGILEQGLIHP